MVINVAAARPLHQDFPRAGASGALNTSKAFKMASTLACLQISVVAVARTSFLQRLQLATAMERLPQRKPDAIADSVHVRLWLFATSEEEVHQKSQRRSQTIRELFFLSIKALHVFSVEISYTSSKHDSKFPFQNGCRLFPSGF